MNLILCAYAHSSGYNMNGVGDSKMRWQTCLYVSLMLANLAAEPITAARHC